MAAPDSAATATPRLLVALAVLVAALVCVPVVAAHANLVAATPGSGDHVAEPPSEVVLQYTEGVQVARVTVTDASGDRVDAGRPRVNDTNATLVHVPLDDPGPGTYTVRWEVLSVDGHTTTGSYFFVVGDARPSRAAFLESLTADDETDVHPVEPVARGLLYVGLLSLVGLAVTTAAVVRPSLAGSTRLGRRLRRIALALAGLLAVGVALLVAVRATGATDATSAAGLRAFLASGIGRLAVLQVALAVATLGVAALPTLGRASAWSRRWLAALAATGTGLALTAGLSSHSAATVETATGAAIDAVHVLGASVWVGGLAALALASAAARRDDAATLAALVTRFSVLGVAGAGVAAATGLLMASWHVPHGIALGSTPYGQLLLGKVGVVVAALGVGALHRLAVGPLLAGSDSPVTEFLARSLPDGRPDADDVARAFRRTVRVELALAVVVLVLAGGLTSVPTALHESHGHGGDPVPLTLFGEAGDADVEVRIVPARAGLAAVDVTLAENGTVVRPERNVTLLLRHPGEDVELPATTLAASGDGRYSAVTAFPVAGQWELRVSTWLDGRFVAERFRLSVEPANATGGHGGGASTGPAEGPLPNFLADLALGVGVAVALGVAYEARRLRCEE